MGGDDQPQNKKAEEQRPRRRGHPPIRSIAAATFDFAVPDQTVAQRPQTVTPQQSLFSMNSACMIEQAKRLAARLEPTNISTMAFLFSQREHRVLCCILNTPVLPRLHYGCLGPGR